MCPSVAADRCVPALVVHAVRRYVRHLLPAGEGNTTTTLAVVPPAAPIRRYILPLPMRSNVSPRLRRATTVRKCPPAGAHLGTVGGRRAPGGTVVGRRLRTCAPTCHKAGRPQASPRRAAKGRIPPCNNGASCRHTSTPHAPGFRGTLAAGKLQIVMMSQPPNSHASTTVRWLQARAIPWRGGAATNPALHGARWLEFSVAGPTAT